MCKQNASKPTLAIDSPAVLLSGLIPSLLLLLMRYMDRWREGGREGVMEERKGGSERGKGGEKGVAGKMKDDKDKSKRLELGWAEKLPHELVTVTGDEQFGRQKHWHSPNKRDTGKQSRPK